MLLRYSDAGKAQGSAHRQTNLRTSIFRSRDKQPSFKSFGKRCIVDKFKIASDRNASSDPCNARHDRMKKLCQIEHCCFTFDIRIESKNDLFHSLLFIEAQKKFSDL